MDEYTSISDEALAALSDDDLNALAKKSQDEFSTLVETGTTPAELAQAETRLSDVRRMEAAQTERAAAAAKFAELKNVKFGTDETAETEVEVEEEAPETEAEVEEGQEEVEEAQEAVVDAPVEAGTKQSAVQRLAGKTARPAKPESEEKPMLSMVASGEFEGHTPGKSLKDMTDVATAIIGRAKGFPSFSAPADAEDRLAHFADQGIEAPTDIRKFGTVALRPEFPEEFTITQRMGDEDMMDVALRAANESRLDGGSLVAAGGWCAPSETMYDLKADESLDGILSLPEIQIKRGGMRYTTGPQFADFYANPGFKQTEAQAISGTTKPCYEVTCPTFTEVRLDAIGLCIKVPILTQAAYPELVSRFASGTLIAHEHWVNADVISRVQTLAGALRTFTGLGGTVDDTLEAFEIVAQQRRQIYRLSFTRAMEAILPVWVKDVFKGDLRRRMGMNDPVTDQMVNAYLKASNINVQWVYDWNGLTVTDEAWPGNFKAILYPSGTFVKGVSDVINLSTVYDAASLSVNTYTGLFVEKGLLVAKVQYDADYVQIPICNAGRRGAQNLTCA